MTGAQGQPSREDERTINRPKSYRAVVTRDDKLAASYLATVTIACTIDSGRDLHTDRRLLAPYIDARSLASTSNCAQLRRALLFVDY